MRTFHLLGVVILACCGAVPADPGTAPPHLSAAEEIAWHVAPEDNDHVYKDIYVRWKGVEGASKYDAARRLRKHLSLAREGP